MTVILTHKSGRELPQLNVTEVTTDDMYITMLFDRRVRPTLVSKMFPIDEYNVTKIEK